MPPLSSASSGGGTLPLSTCHLTPYNLRVPKEPNQCKDSMFAAPLPPGRTLPPMRTGHGTCAFHSQRTMVMPAFMSVSMAQLSENIPTDVPPEALAHWGHRMPPCHATIKPHTHPDHANIQSLPCQDCVTPCTTSPLDSAGYGPAGCR